MGWKRILVVSTEGRRPDARALAEEIGEAAVGVLSIAREHVPLAIVAEGRAAAATLEVDAVFALGGGSAIGLAKAIAIDDSRPSPKIAVIPTTFSGSEMTPVFGVTDGGVKKTGRDERARPQLVFYDPDRLADVPDRVLTLSLWNAMAHACAALFTPSGHIDGGGRLAAEEALRLLARATRIIGAREAAAEQRRQARQDGLEGSLLAGATFGDVGGGVHHKLCHVLGGTFSTPHAATHATLLPHVVRWLSERPGEDDLTRASTSAMARALETIDPLRALAELAVATNVPRDLTELGLREADLERALDVFFSTSSPPCGRAIDREGISALLTSALHANAAPSHESTSRGAQIDSRGASLTGFGGTLGSEALAGALPRTQNTPRPAPYGLYPELLSGTPFTVKSAEGSRVWMYRVRPSYSHSAFVPLPPGRFQDELGPPLPTRTRWSPMPIPVPPSRVDFLDGLVTLGGEGESRGPGYRVSLYAANADMIDRAFSTADGDLLLVPQQGVVDVRTELGTLRAAPGTVVVIPRGLKLAITLPDGATRGWMLEVFGPRLRLPERGLIGSNGLADARHFVAPLASFEDRVTATGFELVHKLGGRLFSATQAHSPFDVVAWQGTHVPFSYDLSLFNAMGSVTWDHVDPSIHTVLTAPLDDHGRAIVDFVVFRGRWDVSEHSFRPPFMHRNAAAEINGVVKTKTPESGYVPGCTFVSPLLTSHGVTTSTYDTLLELPDEQHEGPLRLPDDSMWIMFESSMPFRPTAWAMRTELIDPTFLELFEGMRSRFHPDRR